MTSTTRVALATLAIALLGVAGCSAVDTEAGFGLPTLGANQMERIASEGGSTVETRVGTLNVESDGCFTFEDSARPEDPRAWIIWPDSARHDGDQVVLGSGERLRQGDTLSGPATYANLSELPGGSDESSYLGSFGRFCDADVSGAVLFTDVVP